MVRGLVQRYMLTGSLILDCCFIPKETITGIFYAICEQFILRKRRWKYRALTPAHKVVLLDFKP